MSTYVKSSALRLFEKILEETRNKFKSISGFSSPLLKLVENIVGLGDKVFPKIMSTSDRVARLLNKLQLTMIESMIMASLWSGLIIILLILYALHATR